jgi:predicted RNase H-like HicB family nuclease
MSNWHTLPSGAKVTMKNSAVLTVEPDGTWTVSIPPQRLATGKAETLEQGMLEASAYLAAWLDVRARRRSGLANKCDGSDGYGVEL